jgi:hypothetical protein
LTLEAETNYLGFLGEGDWVFWRQVVGVDGDVAVLDEAIDDGGNTGGAGKTVPHCLKGKCVVITTDRDSCLRLMML